MAASRRIAICITLFGSTSALAQTSVPQQLAYEGRLAALDGTPSTGAHQIKFAIWPSMTGGGQNPLWSDTLTVTVADGLYSVTLGATSDDPLPPALFDGTVRYLELNVDAMDTLSPRQAIGSVPYSILSGGVQGGPVDATSYSLNGSPLVNNAGRTLLSFSSDGGTSIKSVAGLFCAVSPATYTGKIVDASGATGYRATKLICEDLCKAPTAHMCNGQELVSSAELGLPTVKPAWYSTGVYAAYTTVSGSYTALAFIDDCGGWTQESPPNTFSGGYTGMIWEAGTPDSNWCGANYPIACCN